MGLVDGEQADPYSRESAEERIGHEPLGSHVEKVECPRMQPSQHPAGLRLVQSGIIRGGAYPVGNEGVHLVLHQGDQGRHNDGDTGPVERRDLVADRLPPTGRHEDKIVSAPDQSFDDLFLERAESGETEDGLEGIAGRRSLC